MTTDSTPSGPVDPEAPENPEIAATHDDDVPAGEAERVAEDAAVPTPPTTDADEDSAEAMPEPDVVESVTEVPDGADAAGPDAPHAPVGPPVAPVAHSEADGTAPEVEHAVGALDVEPRGGSTVDPPEAHQAPVTDDTASVTVDGDDTWAASEVPWDVADPPGDGGEPAPVTDTSAPGASPTQVRPHGRHEATGRSPATPAVAGPSSSGGWAKLGRAMRPKVSRSQLLAGLLCALLGFALAVQVSQTQEQQLSSLRQSDLVRLLDDVTQRANDLESRVEGLQDTRDELSSGSGQQRAALELAQRQSQTQGILSGRLPAEGPGITLTITETDQRIPAAKLFNILEELRNAGVEVVEVNGIRLVTSSYFEETSRGMVVDGQKISSPYQWQAIGDPSTLETALEIPGGAMSSVRNEGAIPKITQEDLITISSTREPETPEFATPVPAEGGN